MKACGVSTVFHYVPLHDAPYGVAHSRTYGSLPVTRMASDCLLRLPLWLGVEEHQPKIAADIASSLA